MRKLLKKGFTLIEVVSGIAIVGMIATLTIPEFLRVTLNIHEKSAIGTLRAISFAMSSYREVNGTYPSTLSELGSSVVGGEDPSYLDDKVATGEKDGYGFDIASSDPETYLVVATPRLYGVTGNRVINMTEDGIEGEDIPTGFAGRPQHGEEGHLHRGH